MSDKITIKDYLNYFGNKSAEADSLVQNLNRQIEDQRFGTIKPKMTYMQKVKAFNDDPMNQMIMGLVEPGGGLKTVGKGLARGGKNIIDILREALGIGRKEMGDVLSRYKRGVQPDFVTTNRVAKEGQQVIPNLIQPKVSVNKLVKAEGPFKNLQEASVGKYFPSTDVNLASPKKTKEITFEDLYNKIAKQMDDAAQLTDEYDPLVTGFESVEDVIGSRPEDFVELLRRAIGRKPSSKTIVDFAEELKSSGLGKVEFKPKYEFNPKKKK